MELNPGHPTTKSLREMWFKLLLITMRKLGTDHVVITAADIEEIPEGSAVTAQEDQEGLHLRVVDPETARRLAVEYGGLPN